MGSSPPAPESPSTEATWREIHQVVDAIAELAKSEESPSRFYAAVIERLISALAAQGGAIWTWEGDGKVHQECLVGSPHPWFCSDQNGVPSHRDLLEQVLRSDEPRCVPPQWKATAGNPTANPTDFLLVLYPWRVDRNPAGVIELIQRPGSGPQAEQGYLKFLEVIAEILGEFQRNCELRRLKQIARDWARFDQFARQAHAGLDLRPAAYTIVNEGRRFLECDRVSLLVRRGRHYRLMAVSGVEEPNRRAELTHRLERLCDAVAKVGSPLWFPGIDGEHAPELEKLLDEYEDESHARSIGVVPLVAKKTKAEPAIAVLAVEKFLGTFRTRERELIGELSDHTTAALANCLEFERVPFLSILRRLGWLTRVQWLSKGTFGAALIVALVAAAFVTPADFNVVAEGSLQPSHCRDIFARADGTVSDLRVEHGQHVRAGELLAVLRRPQLDLEFKQVLGELQTAQQKLVALETERLQTSHGSDEQRRRYGQATAQEEELRETIRSFQAQYEVLKNKQSECEVRSSIEGDVLTWNVRQLLEDRPVSRGQNLLTIGDLSGPWELELRVPDRQAGHVLAARESQPGEPLKVSYLVAMDPRHSYHGTITRVGMRSETSEPDGAFLKATVDVDPSVLEACTAGAGVRAYIQCGRRSLGYVWLHDLFDTIRTWLFF